MFNFSDSTLANLTINPTDVADVPSINLIHAVIAGTILTFVVLMTIVGNVLVLLAVFVNSHLRSTTNYFIVNLAIADLLLGTTVLPFSGKLSSKSILDLVVFIISLYCGVFMTHKPLSVTRKHYLKILTEIY